jgi:ribose-phosphate pyrophosphokinase
MLRLFNSSTMILNLFNVELSDLKYSTTIFSDGSPHIRFDEIGFEAFKQTLKAGIDTVEIRHKIKSSNDLLTLLLATQVLRHLEAELDVIPLKIQLNLPYFWSARMDRFMSASGNEPFSLKLTADLINAQNYSRVSILDPHSDVTPALVHNAKVISQGALLKSFLHFHTEKGENPMLYTIVSPDAGAIKKCYNTASDAGFDGIIMNATKHRDVTTGHINATTIPVKDLMGANCIILDDLCDGGRTFVELAKVLQKHNAGKLFLIVSHGIFSSGFELLSSFFDEIWTTNSYYDEKSLPAEFAEKVFILNAFDI